MKFTTTLTAAILAFVYAKSPLEEKNHDLTFKAPKPTNTNTAAATLTGNTTSNFPTIPVRGGDKLCPILNGVSRIYILRQYHIVS